MLIYLLVLLLILGSGSIIGWLVPGFGVLQFIISVFTYIIYGITHGTLFKVNKRNFRVLCVSIIILALNIIISSGFSMVRVSYSMFLLLVSLWVIAELIPFEKFVQVYVTLMTWIAMFSTIFWLLAQFDVVIAAKDVVAGNGFAYRMNIFYIYKSADLISGLNTINPRNSGIFWEPGAFQGYLNLALYFCLFQEKNGGQKEKKNKIAILIIAILSTQSTSGYLVLAMIIMMYYFSKIRRKAVTWKTILLLILILIAGVALLYSPVVQDKFTDNSISYSIRLNDNLSGLIAVFEKPILGLGYSSSEYTTILENLGISGNSTGLLIIFQEFGIFVGLLFFYRMYFNFWNFSRVKGISLLLFMAMFTWLNSTEAFATKGCFLILLFSFRNTNRKLDGIGY